MFEGNKKSTTSVTLFAVLKKSSAYSLVVICSTNIHFKFIITNYGKNIRT